MGETSNERERASERDKQTTSKEGKRQGDGGRAEGEEIGGVLQDPRSYRHGGGAFLWGARRRGTGWLMHAGYVDEEVCDLWRVALAVSVSMSLVLRLRAPRRVNYVWVGAWALARGCWGATPHPPRACVESSVAAHGGWVQGHGQEAVLLSCMQR